MAKEKLNWITLAEEFSNKKTTIAYKEYRTALGALKAAQLKFDDMLRLDIAKSTGEDPDHIVISHRYGLGYAIDTDGVATKSRTVMRV